jgi:hypothetical protein
MEYSYAIVFQCAKNTMTTNYPEVLGRASLSILAFTLASGLSLSGFASEPMEFRRTAGLFSVYLSVMPVELTAGPRPAPEPGATPYQPPAAKDTHHVMVSIYESRSSRRVTEAAVAARVAALGFSGEKKALEPIAVAGTAVYANAFPMMGRGPFRVDVEFRMPGAQRHEHATFYFTHPSFAPPNREARKECGP